MHSRASPQWGRWGWDGGAAHHSSMHGSTRCLQPCGDLPAQGGTCKESSFLAAPLAAPIHGSRRAAGGSARTLAPAWLNAARQVYGEARPVRLDFWEGWSQPRHQPLPRECCRPRRQVTAPSRGTTRGGDAGTVAVPSVLGQHPWASREGTQTPQSPLSIIWGCRGPPVLLSPSPVAKSLRGALPWLCWGSRRCSGRCWGIIQQQQGGGQGKGELGQENEIQKGVLWSCGWWVLGPR